MPGSSLLPVTIHNGKLYFLFGKENKYETSAKGFSDFGGGIDKNESVFEAALREGGEELTGFLGDGVQLQKHIKKYGGVFKLSLNDYHVHLFYIPYDQNLPLYYNNNHKFLWEHMDHKVLKNTKLFEKIEIQWFDIKSIKKNMRLFRFFYKDVLSLILNQEQNIFKFVQQKKCLGNKKTNKRKSPLKRKTTKSKIR
jgi:8-oxo-dGTP pyrophosphatase MutT (NUDIX family)